MANAYRCDRCGVFFEKYDRKNNYPCIATDMLGGIVWADLCEKCKADLDLFMQNAPVLKNEHQEAK